MSRTLNKVMLIGNVGKDPEVNFTPTGVKVAQFRLATSETWKDKDGAVQEHTDWHTIIAWRGLADVVEKLVRRGTRIYVEGKIQSRSFEDRDGNKRYVTEIVADNLLLLDPKKAEHSDAPPAQGSDDIPF
ncbi:MAG: single-stranded DNA-binding protein [Ignavibacteria bacterium]|mgnify:FL=1|nr:single-stranded DNA-binding protein [Ignavibacteria bacterium]MBP6509342.1 single-stranded DNA-binding protein [Candidatus Kapabacteria bacterium]MBK6419541.1 single-stranded DNA-binding protein [Ignavibacteria bacterium]MBK6759836.1 single-stranded DNA-binding protein [Ignavibacteria bacterium]MBK7184718.1 single-stranded DNA-binding protein [Ignavibacteria bacterium]